MRTIERRYAAVIATMCIVGGCRRDKPAPAGDSVVVSPPTAAPDTPASAAPAVSGWDRAAGVALLVHGDGGESLVVVPGEGGGAETGTDRTAGEAAAVLPAEVTLFSRAGAAGSAKALPTEGAAPTGCAWPIARLGPASGADAVPSWTVGFVGGSPTPIALDSIEVATDSATLAATVTRLATTLGDDTVRALRGVPFSVRSARRFTFGDSARGVRDGVVAVITRALNQEAAPLAERVLLVAERPHAATGAPPAPWMVTYHERVAGREDDVPATDVLAAVTLGAAPASRVTLVLARALADGTRYTLLERTGAGWRVRWTSATRGC
ncbi:hypothetical protein J421_1156 [Gemmatirosa kalamazoonensis]|uniref:Lipoprotein n=1 Tax=Gemmatirosa kalamazoonensis TaxID=861299 RepID=W0RH38_9BACT|nr:hypothetical protein [Gemmatirosa kalamazoonensis]AHG88693.1 hypothetical protein J421_1156 [Gemmatirosa kalamazoonensis]